MFNEIGPITFCISIAVGVVGGAVITMIAKRPRSWLGVALVALVSLLLFLLTPYIMTSAWLYGVSDESGQMSGIPLNPLLRPFFIGLFAAITLISLCRLTKCSKAAKTPEENTKP